QGRIGIAVASSSPSTVYAIYADEIGYFNGLFRSSDGGESWTRMSGSGLGSFYSSYGWWFGRIWVHPTDENEIWVNGVTLHSSRDGGRSFGPRATNAHVDHHALWI